MKVLFANQFNFIRGGCERVLFAEKAFLENNRIETAVFSRKHPNHCPTRYDHCLPRHLDIDGAHGLAKISIARELIYSNSVAKHFSKMIDEFKPNIIHGHNIYGRLTTSIIDVAKRKGIPFVITLHDCKLVCPTYLLLRNGRTCELCADGSFWKCFAMRCHRNSYLASAVYATEAYIARIGKKYDYISCFISPSGFNLRMNMRAGNSPEKFFLLRNPVRLEPVSLSGNTGKYALYVGRLSREKGLETSILAAARAHVPLKIAGTGPAEEQYRRIATDTGYKDIEFLGFKCDYELDQLYSNALCVVVPSKCYENSPMSILEAFSKSIPALGSSIGGIPELIREDETGSLFEPGNVEKLAFLLSKYASNKKTVQEMGKRARKYVENENAIEKHMTNLFDIYSRAIGRVL